MTAASIAPLSLAANMSGSSGATIWITRSSSAKTARLTVKAAKGIEARPTHNRTAMDRSNSLTARKLKARGTIVLRRKTMLRRCMLMRTGDTGLLFLWFTDPSLATLPTLFALLAESAGAIIQMTPPLRKFSQSCLATLCEGMAGAPRSGLRLIPLGPYPSLCRRAARAARRAARAARRSADPAVWPAACCWRRMAWRKRPASGSWPMSTSAA